ncbi:MAG: hypothetical protein BZY88_00285 [SAR202 cluster bacterium Io17-Chloro-G9]|nr:MAG: hypothetical protein BZY88_00285 [SAR202 cluster bacterium Io17-Chloro-G9]
MCILLEIETEFEVTNRCLVQTTHQQSACLNESKLMVGAVLETGDWEVKGAVGGMGPGNQPRGWPRRKFPALLSAG